MHQIHVKNVKLKQYISCKHFVEHVVSAERQWMAERSSSEEWRARGATTTRGRWRKQRRCKDRPGKRRPVTEENGVARTTTPAPGSSGGWTSAWVVAIQPMVAGARNMRRTMQFRPACWTVYSARVFFAPPLERPERLRARNKLGFSSAALI